MTQTVVPPHAARLSPAPTLSIHGTDPETHVPVTWHVTSLSEDGAPGTFLVERAIGDIRSPALWMQAQRDARTVGAEQVLDLVRRAMVDGDLG